MCRKSAGAPSRNTLRERKSDRAYNDWLRQLRDRTYGVAARPAMMGDE